MASVPRPQDIEILPLGLKGLLSVPDGASGIVLFAHGSGSSRLSPRNTQVARAFNEAGLATLLFDLLLPSEANDRHKVFDIPLLAGRLEEALDWIEEEESTADLAVGCSAPAQVRRGLDRGSGPTGADLRRRVAGRQAGPRGGRARRRSGTDAADRRGARHGRHRAEPPRHGPAHVPDALGDVPGATHLFEEPGTLDRSSPWRRLGSRYLEKSPEQ